MLVQTISSLLKMNQKRVNSLFMQVKSTNSLTDSILLFYIVQRVLLTS